MTWWHFVTTDGREGYTNFDEQGMQIGMYWLDGTPIEEGISYTVDDANAPPPEWSL